MLRRLPPRMAAPLTATWVGLVLWIGLAVPAQANPTGSAATATATCGVLQHTFARLQDEKPQNLCQYAGKVVVVVNTASYCGYTGQYKGLEALYDRYKTKGLVVLGFPANNFGAQEPGNNAQIAAFCENTFGVRFPMLAKTSVVGPDANPLHKALAAKTGQPPGWNFHKYIIGRDGQTVFSHPSATNPQDRPFVADVERLLAQR